METHPAFEKAIDENPLEATTHMAYADWHDEQGQHDEAAFRRAMGEWVQSSPNFDQRKRGMNFGIRADRRNLPQGVNQSYFEGVYDRFYNRLSSDTHRPILVGGIYHWDTYRGMEDAFRRSFMANRAANPEKNARRMSRILHARRCVNHE